MNLFIRFGEWLEGRKKISRRAVIEIYENLSKRDDEIEKRISMLPKQEDLNQKTLKEFALINVRLNRIELLVGLKREPEAVKVPHTPRIG